MSDDLSKVMFGDAIEMTGKRPAWLEDGIPMRWSAGGNPYLDVKSHECVNWGQDYPVSIRLPVDHPCYRQITELKGLTTNETLPPDDLAKRMEACIRAAAAGKPFDMAEARAIVALLPEPVDADLVEAREICARVAMQLMTEDEPERWAADYREGAYDRDPEMQHALWVLRTRALERDSREG